MDRWQHIQKIFDDALQLPPERRGDVIARECGGDQTLRQEVESLLEAHEGDPTFMEVPVAVNLPELMQQDIRAFQPGQVLGGYQITGWIGRGGMGEVYSARDVRLKREVAIKVLPQAFAADNERVRRFRQEARLAAALNHPNIISIFDIGVSDGLPYIVCELLHGQSLRELLQEGRVPVRQALTYSIQAARALAAAHDAGVVHRDLKPDNLFITQSGQVKILDFGLAKLIHPAIANTTNDTVMTTVGQVFGTLGYMSPEQARGQGTDNRSDIFSFGAVLYELFAGNRAFAMTSAADTLSAILNYNPPVVGLTPPIHPVLGRSIRQALEKDPAERFQSAHDLALQLESVAESSYSVKHIKRGWWALNGHKPRRVKVWSLALLSLIAVLIGGLYRYSPHTRAKLNEKDTILLADIVNTTGDPVFDDTLKQGLSVALSQSPFLNLLREEKIGEVLKLMGRTPDERITQEVAREICLRTNSKVTLSGSISGLGSHFVIGLKAINCQDGELLAAEQVEAAAKEQVLQALDKAASDLRTKLGESVTTLRKYGAPLEEATTKSLEALQAFSKGTKTLDQQGDVAAIPMFERAIELDPGFAMAYGLLGITYLNIGQTDLSNKNLSKAFELRGKTSDNENFEISSFYYLSTGDLERYRQINQQWAASYPRNFIPFENLAVICGFTGQYEKGLANALEGISLNPDNGYSYGSLMSFYVLLGRLDEAKATYEQAMARKLDNTYLHMWRYGVAFLERNETEMRRQVSWAAGIPAAEDVLLSFHSDTEAYYGRQARALELSNKAAGIAKRNEEKEVAALMLFDSALRNAETGKSGEAISQISAGLALANSQGSQVLAALAAARVGNSDQASRLADELSRRSAHNTMLRDYWLPTIRAAVELNRHNPLKALAILEATSPYEFGFPPPDPWCFPTFYPVYLRGEAYLKAGRGRQAAAEFDKLIDHRFIVGNAILAALARLQLARAKSIDGDKASAREAYRDFIDLWKDADPDVPVLKEAKVEYAMLQ
jgi:pentatricopeptide repeat protein